MTVSAYRRGSIARALDGFGFLVPQCERRQILGTLFSSTLFDNRAPPGVQLLTSFVGGMRQSALVELDDARVAAFVQSEQAVLLAAPAGIKTDVQIG